VFVVQPDNTVENVPVKVSSTIDGLNVIEQGIKPNDQVVIDGQANLVSGSKIRRKSSGSGGDSQDGHAPGNQRGKSGKRRHSKPAGGES
jgi:multidrug efflux system membrane fusion protein